MMTYIIGSFPSWGTRCYGLRRLFKPVILLHRHLSPTSVTPTGSYRYHSMQTCKIWCVDRQGRISYCSPGGISISLVLQFLLPPVSLLLRRTDISHFNTMDQEKQSHVSEKEILAVAERDVLALARLGKKPILKVYLPLLNLFGILNGG